MPNKKRTREEIEADRQALEDELAGLDEEDDDSEIIVIHGSKNIRKWLSKLGLEEEESEEESEEEEEPEPPKSKKPVSRTKKPAAKPPVEEEEEQEEEEEEEEPDPAPLKKHRYFS